MNISFDESIELADNAMLKHKPELFNEWNFEKNDELGLSIYQVTYGSDKIAWWTCSNCKSEYDSRIKLRLKSSPHCCPFGSGRRVNHTNSLSSLKPNLASEWHPTKNGKLTPHDVTVSSNRKVWWKCEKDHEWKVKIEHRSGATLSGCPYCYGREVWKGFNDMWTTNPELASQLLNPEDGYRYTQSSGRRVDWRCGECENIIRDRIISSINDQGLSCPRCSDGIKFPEKFMYNLLRECNIDFNYDETQDWSQGRRYDFYLPKYNIIIETHGEQHYEVSGFERMGGETLIETRENDTLKRELAKKNSVSKYIVIDCRYSTVEWIKSSVENSELAVLIDMETINWQEIGRLASNSLIKRACDLWMSGIHSTTEIAKKVKLNKNTVSIYLKRGAEIGWCDYCPKEAMKISGLKSGKKNSVPIVMLDINGTLIRHWNSLADVERETDISASNISSALRKKSRTAGGFIWMYKEDYERRKNKIE